MGGENGKSFRGRSYHSGDFRYEGGGKPLEKFAEVWNKIPADKKREKWEKKQGIELEIYTVTLRRISPLRPKVEALKALKMTDTEQYRELEEELQEHLDRVQELEENAEEIEQELDGWEPTEYRDYAPPGNEEGWNETLKDVQEQSHREYEERKHQYMDMLQNGKDLRECSASIPHGEV
jgi:chromosome segregation ATPase